MEGDEELSFQREDDPLSNASEAQDLSSLGRLERWVPRPEERDRAHLDALEPGADDPRLERVEVLGDLGKLGHPAESGRPHRSVKRSISSTAEEPQGYGDGQWVPRSWKRRWDGRDTGLRDFLSLCVPFHFHSLRRPRVDGPGVVAARGLPNHGSMWIKVLLTS